MDGRRLWKLLSMPTKLARKMAVLDVAPNEFLYNKLPSRSFDTKNLPPILNIVLSTISTEPDSVYFSLEQSIPQLPMMKLSELYESVFGAIATEVYQEKKEVWIERSGGSIMYLREILNDFPSCRYIFLYRDGRDTALAWCNFAPTRFLLNLSKLLPGSAESALGSSRIRHWLAPIASYVMATFFPLEYLLNRSVDAEHSARVWGAAIGAGISVKQLSDVKIYVIFYENLCADPKTELTKLCDFLDVSANTAWLESVTTDIKVLPSRYNNLDTKSRIRLDQLVRPAQEATLRFLTQHATNFQEINIPKSYNTWTDKG